MNFGTGKRLLSKHFKIQRDVEVREVCVEVRLSRTQFHAVERLTHPIWRP